MWPLKYMGALHAHVENEIAYINEVCNVYVVVPSIALQLLLSSTRDSCSHALLSCNGRPGFQLAVATSGKLPDVSNEMQKDHACVLSHPCMLLHPFQTIAFCISRDFLSKDS